MANDFTNDIARRMLNQHSVKINNILAHVAKFGGSHELIKTIDEIREEERFGKTKLTPSMSRRLDSLQTTLKARVAPGQVVGKAATVQETSAVFRQGQKAIFNNAYIEVGGKATGFGGGRVYDAMMRLRQGHGVAHVATPTTEGKRIVEMVEPNELWRRRARLYGQMRQIDRDSGATEYAQMRRELTAIDDAIERHYQSGVGRLFGGTLPSHSTEYMNIKRARQGMKKLRAQFIDFDSLVNQQVDKASSAFEALGLDAAQVSARAEEYMSPQAFRLMDMYEGARSGVRTREFWDTVDELGQERAARWIGSLRAASTWNTDRADLEYHSLGLTRGQWQDTAGNPHWVSRNQNYEGFAKLGTPRTVSVGDYGKKYTFTPRWVDGLDEADFVGMGKTRDLELDSQTLFDSDVVHQLQMEQDQMRSTLRLQMKYGEVQDFGEDPISKLVQMKAASRGNYTLTRIVDREIRAYEEVHRVNLMSSIGQQAERLSRMPKDAWKASYIDALAGTPDFGGTLHVAKNASQGTAAYLRGRDLRYMGSAIIGGQIRSKVGVSFTSPETVRVGSMRDLVHEWLNVGELQTKTRSFERKSIIRELEMVKRRVDLNAKKVFGESSYLVHANTKAGMVARVFETQDEAAQWAQTLSVRPGYEVSTKRLGFREISRVAAGGEYTRESPVTRRTRILTGVTESPLDKRVREEATEAIRDFAAARTRDPIAKTITRPIEDSATRNATRLFLSSEEFRGSAGDSESLQRAFINYVSRARQDGSKVEDIADNVLHGIRTITSSMPAGQKDSMNRIIISALQGRMDAMVDMRSSLKYEGKYAKALFEAADTIVAMDKRYGKHVGRGITNRQLEENISQAVEHVLSKYGFNENDELYDLFRRSLFNGTSDSSGSVIASAKSLIRQMGSNMSNWSDTGRRNLSPDRAARNMFGMSYDELSPSMRRRVETFLNAYDESHYFMVDAMVADESGDVLDTVKGSSLSDVFGRMRDAISGAGYEDETAYRRLREMLRKHGIEAMANPEDIGRVAAGVTNETSALARVASKFDINEDGYQLARYVTEYMGSDRYSGGSIEEVVDNAIHRQYLGLKGRDLEDARHYVHQQRRSFINLLHDRVYGETNNAGIGSPEEFMLTEAMRNEKSVQDDAIIGLTQKVIEKDDTVREVELGELEQFTDSELRKQAMRYHQHDEELDYLHRAEISLPGWEKSKRVNSEQALEIRESIRTRRAQAVAGQEAIDYNIGLRGQMADFEAAVDDFRSTVRGTWEYYDEMKQMLEGSLERNGGTFDTGDVVSSTAQFIRSLSPDDRELSMKQFNDVLNDIILPTYRNGTGDPNDARKALGAVFGGTGDNIEVNIARVAVRQSDDSIRSHQVMLLHNTEDPNSKLVAYKLTQTKQKDGNWRWTVGRLEGSEIVETIAERDIVALQDTLSRGSIDTLNKALIKIGRNQSDIKRKMRAILPEVVPEDISNVALYHALQEHGALGPQAGMSSEQVADTYQAAMMGGERRGLLDQIFGGLVGGNVDEVTDYDEATVRLIDQEKLQRSINKFMEADRAGRLPHVAEQADELGEAFNTLNERTPQKFIDELSTWMNKGNVKRNIAIGATVMGLAAAKRIHDRNVSDNTELMLQMDHPGSESVVRVASNEDGYAGTVKGRRGQYGAVSPHGPQSVSSLSSTMAIRDNLKTLTATDIDDILAQG